MATQSFQAVRRLQDAGAPLPLVLANPAWQGLMDKIDSNINERSAILAEALNKIPLRKRPEMRHLDVEDSSEPAYKRSRGEAPTSDLAARKQALLTKIDQIEGGPAAPPAKDDYEAYRRQCWIQYYEWMEKQKQGPAPPTANPAHEPDSSSEDEDEEIHNALLGIS